MHIATSESESILDDPSLISGEWNSKVSTSSFGTEIWSGSLTAVRARRVALLCGLGDVALSEVEIYGYRKCLVQNIQDKNFGLIG